MELMPFPLSFNRCGLSRASSFSLKRALRPAVVKGVKVTLITQALFGPTVLPYMCLSEWRTLLDCRRRA